MSGKTPYVRTPHDKLAEFVSVKDFGAKGDGVTDDSRAFAAAMAVSRRVYAPASVYRVSNVAIPAGTIIYGDGDASVLRPALNTDRGVFTTDSGGAAQYVEGVTIRDLKFRGDVATAGFSEQKHLMTINGGKRWLIEGCTFEGFRGDAIYIGSGDAGGLERHNKNITVRRCLFDGVNKDNRNAISVIDGDGVAIYRNRFVNCSRADMPGPVTVEPDLTVFTVVKNIKVEDNHIQDCGGATGAINVYLKLAYGVGAMTTPPENFSIRGNTIVDVTSPAILVRFKNSTTPVWLVEAHGVHNVSISGNTANSGQIVVEGVRGVSISDNATSGTAQIFVGTISSTTVGNVIDAQVFNNRCRGVTGIYGGICLGNVSHAQVKGNELYKVSQAAFRGVCVMGDGAVTVSDNVEIFNNHFVGTYTSHVYSASHTPTPASTYVYDNTKEGGGAITVSAALTYQYPNRETAGAFTPVLFDSSGGFTYTQAGTGNYTRFGSLVFCNFSIPVSAISGSGGGGGIRISGLPFPANAGLGTVIVPLSISAVDIPAGYSAAAAILLQGQSTIYLREQGDNIADAALTTAAVTAATVISGSFVYRV